jgi:hypothetical protein
MAEALYGEPRWTYNLARRGQPAEYQHPFLSPPPYFEGKSGVLEPDFSHRPDLEPQAPAEPEKTKPQTEPRAATPTTTAGDRICPKHNVAKLRNGCRECRREQARNGGQSSGVRNPVCPRHGQKTKDGMKHGHQQYRCVPCHTENPLRLVEHSYEDFCKHHNQKKYKNGVEKRTGKQKYRCPECLRANKGKPPSDAWKSWSGEELREHFIGVARKHGGSPQNVEDAAHSMIAVLSDGTRTFEELHEPAIARRYVSSINRLSADGHTTLDLDAPVGTDDKSKMTFADTKPADESESDPHQQLEAKETVTA